MPADLCNFEVLYPGRVRLFHCSVWSMSWDSLLTHHPQPPAGHQQTSEVSKIPATPSHLISATLPHHLHLSASIHPYFFISKTQASCSPEEPSPWLSGVRSFLHQFVAGMRQQLLPSSLFFPTRALEPHGPIFKSLQSTSLLPSRETLPVLSPGLV